MRKAKLFTPIILAFTLIFLIAGYKLIYEFIISQSTVDLPVNDKDKSKWTGIIDLWDVSFITSGTGNHSKWLYAYIRSFEKENPGVYIKVRHMTAERLKLYLGADKDSNFLPDIISIDPYRKYINSDFLADITGSLDEEEYERLHPAAKELVSDNGRLIGIPWMMGAYGYIINISLINKSNLNLDEYIKNDCLTLDDLDELVRKMSYQMKSGKKMINYYGFNTYSTEFSNPILSMIYSQSGTIENKAYNLVKNWIAQKNIIYGNLSGIPYAESLSHFTSEKRSAVMLGGSNVIYTLRRLDNDGKGFDYAVVPVSDNTTDKLFTDQVAAYGLLQADDEDKKELCILFLKGMIKKDNQLKLKDIGMFSVLNDLNDLYTDDEEMSVLEKSLANFGISPFNCNEEELSNLLSSLQTS